MHARDVLTLFLAALLEAGGDAIVRVAQRSPTAGVRIVLFAAGAVVLFCYGRVVNGPNLDFGRLLGLYVVFFFVIAQLIAWLVFKQPPSTAVMLGGLFIVGGGIIVAVSKL